MGMLMRRHANRYQQNKKNEVLPATPPVAPAPAPKPPPEVPEGHTPLPEDFPGREPLQAAGVVSLEQLAEVDDLTAIRGIGKATAERIDQAEAELAQARQQKDSADDGENKPPQDPGKETGED